MCVLFFFRGVVRGDSVCTKKGERYLVEWARQFAYEVHVSFDFCLDRWFSLPWQNARVAFCFVLSRGRSSKTLFNRVPFVGAAWKVAG